MTFLAIWIYTKKYNSNELPAVCVFFSACSQCAIFDGCLFCSVFFCYSFWILVVVSKVVFLPLSFILKGKKNKKNTSRTTWKNYILVSLDVTAGLVFIEYHLDGITVLGWWIFFFPFGSVTALTFIICSTVFFSFFLVFSFTLCLVLWLFSF